MNQTEFNKYLAGFIDGDGSIHISNSTSSVSICIDFIQSIESFVIFINKYFNNTGKIYEDKRSARISYKLRFCGENCIEILENIRDHLIIKTPQCDLAIKFLNSETYDEKKVIGTDITFLNKNKHSYEKQYNLTPEYIAGLFDAEGCITFSNYSLRVKLTQKSDIEILHQINKYYNNDIKISNYSCVFYGFICRSYC